VITDNSADTHHPRLIIGLGNPGREYRSNRHNIGFMVVDQLAQDWGASFSSVSFQASFTDLRRRGTKIMLAKPQTYMNQSGRAVRSLVNFYKLPLANLLVIYDDVDLPFGALRLKPSGGAAGQKGMKSIIRELGSRDFPRLRVGIGRPPGRMSVSSYVLQDFDAQEREELEIIIQEAADAAARWLDEGIERAMTTVNQHE
jgi:PTH1 family peptidyl-tRNA hydrolase